MSVKKLGLILFSSFLIFATAPLAPAQEKDTTKQDTATKKSQKKSAASKDQSTTTDQSTSTTAKSKSEKTEKKTTTGAEKSTTGKNKKETKESTRKSSSLSHRNVREIQEALKKEGFDPGPMDGAMGAMTMTALRNYQLWNHLEATGTVTAETENSLLKGGATARRSSLEGNESQPYSSKELSQDQAPPSTHESLGLNSEANVTSVDDVKKFQQDLSDLGYEPGEINGMMSSDTQQAIRQFQWFNDLPVTGTLDQPTIASIENQENGAVENAQLNQSESSIAGQNREKPSAPVQQGGAYNQDTTSTSHHQDKDAKHHERNAGKADKDAAERVNKAAAVLQDLTSSSDKRVPDNILERAEAVAVIPHMIKGAFGIGGSFGKGVVSERNSDRWSAPAFIEIGGGSFGAQLGVEATDLVLVFTDRAAMDKLEKGMDLKLGVDAGIAAGPIGRSAEAGVNSNLRSAIYAYSRSKGLFAGIALDGAVLNMDKNTNEKVYGASVAAKQILNGGVAANATVRPFQNELDKVVPKKRISQR